MNDRLQLIAIDSIYWCKQFYHLFQSLHPTLFSRPMQVAPFGSWKSPITAETIVANAVGLSSIVIDGTDIYWLESRPQEGGRNAIVRLKASGKVEEVTPPDYNVRSRVHEYGGGAYTVFDGHVYFSNDRDGCICSQNLNSPNPKWVQNLTQTTNIRYADLCFDRRHQRIICVREDHEEGTLEPSNSLISISITNPLDIQVIASGHDFYAAPRLSADGHKLSWLSWNHPNMPWDGTNLFVADLHEDDGSLGSPKLVAGGQKESIFQPQWSGDGMLYFISDRSGWGNLYRWNGDRVEALCPLEAEFGMPQWVFGMSTYAFVDEHHLVCAYSKHGLWRLGLFNTTSKKLTRLNVPFTDVSSVKVQAKSVVCIAANPVESAAIVKIDLLTEEKTIVKRSQQLAVDPAYISQPKALSFPTANGLKAYAFYYPPTNPDYRGPSGQKPPLLVKSHGGPTAASSSQLNLRTQYWTSRGFAVIDVNYRGSTGYGRAYRQSLEGQWGVADVDDCCNAAKYLAGKGLVDSRRMAISGGSAGGYTTLCALVFRDVFKAGASYYGVSDLVALARETHKFESRYHDRLVAPYPAGAAIYQSRSPINFTHQLSCPAIFFQGLEDRVVPANQAEKMVEALKSKGVPVAYVSFPTEGHGFRQAATIQRALTGEYYFYSRVFDFEPAEAIEPIPISHPSIATESSTLPPYSQL
jgi:dipeptidyl aminopeptidase/acylaminoacyl peptidase